MKSVYLAGPITGLSYDKAVGWREFVANVLPDIEVLSPLRSKHYLRNEQNIQPHYPASTLSNARGILTRDYFDVMRSDVLLVNFTDSEAVSVGTVIEIAWAYAARIPVVPVLPPDNVHDNPLLHEMAGFVVGTLTEAVDVVKALLY